MKKKPFGFFRTLTVSRISNWKSGKGCFIYGDDKKRLVLVFEKAPSPELGQKIKAELYYAFVFRSYAIESYELV